jgi:hypothetical protein
LPVFRCLCDRCSPAHAHTPSHTHARARAHAHAYTHVHTRARTPLQAAGGPTNRRVEFDESDEALGPIRGVFDDGKNPRLAYAEAVGRVPLDLKAELHQAGKFLKSQVPAATGHARVRARLCGEVGCTERRREHEMHA